MNPFLVIIILFVLLLVAVFAISAVENRMLDVSDYMVMSEIIPDEFQGCRFVVLADLHNCNYWDKNKKLIRIIRELDPEFIVVAGDMVVANDAGGSASAISLIKELSSKYPVFYANGNHELEMRSRTGKDPERFSRYLSAVGEKVVWLNNQTVALSRDKENGKIQSTVLDKSAGMDKNQGKVFLHGLDMDKRFYKRFKLPEMPVSYLEECVGKASEDGYHILIAHHPDYFCSYADWGADLTLSGHIHGGMVRLPIIGGVVSPTVRLFPRYSKGKYRIGEKIMLLSAGLGTHTLKIRVNNRPEILLVTLNGDGQ